jgi:hypothetical protein
MQDEFQALLDNGTWTLVPCPAGANVVSGKWVFQHKFHSDGTLARYKARWVVRGYSQCPGVDYDETLSPQASHHPISSEYCRISYLAHPSIGRQKCFSTWPS